MERIEGENGVSVGEVGQIVQENEQQETVKERT